MPPSYGVSYKSQLIPLNSFPCRIKPPNSMTEVTDLTLLMSFIRAYP